VSQYTQAFIDDRDALGIKAPTSNPVPPSTWRG